MTGKWLTATHISAAQHLMKASFPSQNGLNDTSALEFQHKWQASPHNFVQIIHVQGCHWACVSNKFSPVNTVDIYDSGHFYPSSGVLTQVTAILKSSQSFELRVVNVQQQQGGDDCGLFAIAFAVDLCMGNDPFVSTYAQEAMRDHLAKCFENNQFVQFAQETRFKRRRVLSVHEVACNTKKVCSRKRLCKN